MNQYLELVRHVLANGTRKENRTGIDTWSTFGYYYEHDLRDGFPLLTTKQINFKNIVIELLWFLSGTNDSAFLERHKCGFWKPWYNKDGTVNAAYGPAWRRFEYPRYYESETGLNPDGYTVGWNDQVRWVVDRLKKNPMARDLVVSAWQPHIAQRPPSANAYWAPCHCMFIFNVQNEEVYDKVYWVYASAEENSTVGSVLATCEEEALRVAKEKYPDLPDTSIVSDAQGDFDLKVAKALRWNPPGAPDGWLDEPLLPKGTRRRLCLHLSQRSADVILGVPYNIASYALLCHLMARFTDLEPGVFAHTLVDAHIYCAKPDGSKAEYDHTLGAREQLTREPRRLPHLHISDDIRSLEDVERLLHPTVSTDEVMGKFFLDGYDPHPALKFKVAV